MTTITAKEFYSAWLAAVEKKENILLEKWHTPSEFTKLIKGSERSIVSNVAEQINIEVYEQDYYSIDSIFYLKKDLLENPFKGKYWFKKLRIAFEHENNFNRGVLEEVVHLLLLKCELRVLVIYPNDTPYELLKEISAIIQSVDQDSEVLKTQGFLIICGYYSGFEWQGFAYDGTDNWEALN
jgi:hypothetical protein